MLYQQQDYLLLSEKPGVYTFLDKNKKVLYVGKAKNLKSRVSSYFTKGALLGPKTKALVEKVSYINTTEVESEVESLLLEAFFIKKHKPKYNIRLIDNKSYPLIQITIKNKIPSVLVSRTDDDKSSVYYGPFPNSGAVKLVLKTLRKIIPFVSVKNHPKHKCLYYHLKLCPCPNLFADNEQKEYKKNIKLFIKILEGNSKKVLPDLKKQRDIYTKNEQFEKALDIQKRIEALELIIQPVHKPFEYDTNPNLRDDIRNQELIEFEALLKLNGLTVKFPTRIECYDISNTSGVYATGSQVVLTDAEIDKSQYRKYKIKKDGSPNDFAMMSEMLKRRLKHEEWEFPQLIIVDGGKGQVSAVQKVLQELKLEIPLLGLAKREETLIVPISQKFYTKVERPIKSKLYGNNEDSFIEINLIKDSKPYILVTRIRNEAHRFAITYHRKIRQKMMLS